MTQVVLSNMLITSNSLSIVNYQQLIQELTSLQKRIYKAAIYHNYKLVHKLQKLLLKSRSVKFVILYDITNNYIKFYDTLSKDINLIPLLIKNPDFQGKYKEQYIRVSKLHLVQLHSFLADHITITNLHQKIISNQLYLSLKPEWEAKFVSNSLINSSKHSYQYKIAAILYICSQYNQHLKTKCSKFYILKNKTDILQTIYNLDFTYLKNKLNTTNSINIFIEKYLTLCPNFNALKKSQVVFNHQNFVTFPSNLLSLLKNIIMEDLNTEIYLCKSLFVDIVHKNDNIFQLSRFLWHEGYFIFFSNSKNEIILIRKRITNLLTKMGLVFDKTNLPILEFKNGFNFLDFYIQSSSVDNILVQASMKSQLILIKEIKSILYHKDNLNRIRPNTYLSFWSAIAKVNYIVQKWKAYYANSNNTNNIIYSKLNIIIQAVLCKWQNKNHKKHLKIQAKSTNYLRNKLRVKNLVRICILQK